MSHHYSVNISAIGLSSSLGGRGNACAAFRCGLNRFSFHPTMANMNPGDEEEEPIVYSPAATHLMGYQGIGRIVKMLIKAYEDLLSNTSQQIEFDGLELFMALPDPEDREFDMEYTEEVSEEKRLSDYADLVAESFFSRIDHRLALVSRQVIFGDRTAFASLLKSAMERLSQDKAKHCLLLLADSLVEDKMLDYLWGRNLLKTSNNPSGFIPGEGAAMILLSSSSVKSEGSLSTEISVEIDDSLNDDESDLDNENDEHEISQAERESWLGGKIMSVLLPLLEAQYENKKLPQLVSDMNGETKRAMEMGRIKVEFQKRFPGAYALEDLIPATSFGEVGTPSGALAMAVVLAAVERGHAKHSQFIILLSEDDGPRAAIKLQF